jgi:hypothetical protein
MTPDLRRPVAAAWGALVGAAVVGALGLWFVHDPTMAERVQALGPVGDPGAEPAQTRIAKQEEAVRQLQASIDRLKAATSFQVRNDFRILPDSPNRNEREPSLRWQERYIAVKLRLFEGAKRRNVTLDPNIGFSVYEKSMPKPDDLPHCLEMLQLVEKALDIALGVEAPLKQIEIKLGDYRGNLTGPAGRPPLLREFRITLSVQGQMESILEMLHAMAQTKEEGDHPLVFCGGSISSENRKDTDSIPTLTARIELAGMRFVTGPERGGTSVLGAASNSAAAAYRPRP